MDYKELKNKYLNDPSTAAEYADLEPEYQIVYAVLQGRKEMDLTQQQLADVTGIDRADISRIENGSANPSLSTIKRVAAGLGKKVEIRFV